MSHPNRLAERQPTDTSSPMPVDAAHDLLAVVRELEARVAVLRTEVDDLRQRVIPRPGRPVVTSRTGRLVGGQFVENKRAMTPSDALSAALRLPTVPDAYGR